MKKAELEFVTFDTEDVITTSGSVHDGIRHYYIGQYEVVGKELKVSDDSFLKRNKGDSREYANGRGLNPDRYPALAANGKGTANCWFYQEGSVYYPCPEDHTGW